MARKTRGFSDKLPSYGDAEFSKYLRTVFLKSMGYTDEALERPIIGIANTYSAYNSCHATVPTLIEAIKRGVMIAGGLPFEFPVISLHESFCTPTSMYLRNLMSMDTEEMIRAQPMDAVVLVGGCDKTVPALLMGAASAGTPAILEVTGPMLTGSYRGQRVGACTDCRGFWGRYRAGEITQEQLPEITDQLGPTPGTCMVMGTASTMALISEALGLMLPGGATIPAVHSQRLRHGEQTGAQAVALANSGLTLDKIMTPEAVENAVRVLLAIGGSTNGLIHLTAMAGRLGIEVCLDRVDELARETPVIVDLKPTGEHYMQELHEAGGFAAILRTLAPLLDTEQKTVTGKPLKDALKAAPEWPQSVVRPLDNPLSSEGGLAVLRGNLAPGGAVIKQSAASAELRTHTGRAIVFESVEDLANRIDDPDLDVTRDDILVMRNAGPVGAPGMPEAGYLPIPKKLAQAGVTDMVRISDARMSGTAYGSIVLHVTPEAAIGGPLCLIETGDRITMDIPNRRLEVDLSDKTLQARAAAIEKKPARPTPERGFARLFDQTVLQADKGCDFDFLAGK
ncbi:MAG TPA: dihydroxy-acid dehydratase [Rhizobiales bacterium]|nr:L-arabonate dehydratase [bacterium BMS3Bbin10]HDO51937.1 dihydroxy-acid dehydratase [Hyphomicrobiales bacterium]